MYKNIMEKKSLDCIIDFNRIILLVYVFLCYLLIFLFIYISFLLLFFCLLLFYLFSFVKSYSLTCFMFAVLRVFLPFLLLPVFFFFFFFFGRGGVWADGPI